MASGGLRELIPTIARTAVVAGVDGIFMEVRTGRREQSSICITGHCSFELLCQPCNSPDAQHPCNTAVLGFAGARRPDLLASGWPHAVAAAELQVHIASIMCAICLEAVPLVREEAFPVSLLSGLLIASAGRSWRSCLP